MLQNKWIAIDEHLCSGDDQTASDRANSIFTFVKFLFKLHAIFKGSFSAERLVAHAESILMRILDINKQKENLPAKEVTSLGIDLGLEKP